MRLHLGITVGDPAGIGPEVTVKALVASGDEILRRHTVLLFAPQFYIQQVAERAGVTLDTKPLDNSSEIPNEAGLSCIGDYNFACKLGQPTATTTRATLAALRDAATMATAGRLDAIVTGPVNKSVLEKMTGETFIGQTELVAQVAGAPRFAMSFFSDGLKVVLLTAHMRLRDAIQVKDPELLATKIELLTEAIARLGIRRPRIAVAGLNPHASEEGLFGDEEATWIQPAIEKIGNQVDADISGPHAPDTIFFRALTGEFDGVVALYHDQGLIPIKLFGPGHAANVTLGLPFIRTSPDHGTAYGIADRNIADPAGMGQALRWAIRLAEKSSGQ